MNRAIYLDYAASTPPDRRVFESMTNWLWHGGNPHARHHRMGESASEAVEKARMQIANRIEAMPDEVIFTSGATEANNLAIAGLARHLQASGKTHIVTSAVEHKSVLEPLKALDGFSVSILPVKPCGMIEASAIEKALTAETGLVCIQAVNNEVGVIQPLEEIAAMLAGRGILFHCDAAQALGKIDFDVRRVGVDFASLSAHKAYGPQGIGALYIKKGCAACLQPLQHGGGQEQGLRSGTLPLPLCVGFGTACDIIADDRKATQAMRDDFLKRLSPLNPIVNGHSDPAWNVPGILNIHFPGIDNETLVMALPDLAFGLGSACNSVGNVHSHVIEAMTGSAAAARESIRMSFGRMTTQAELQQTAEQIVAAINDIRQCQEAA